MLRFRTRLAFPLALGATAVLAAACSSGGAYGGDGAPPPPASAPAATGAAPAPTTTVGLAPSRLGTLLVDAQGRTIYLFEQDTTDSSTCDGACATNWPPVLASGTPASTGDISAADLGTTTRRDGTVQVTFHDHPLYRFASDHQPGDVTGQGLNAFGAAWYVIGPDGGPIKAA